MDQETNVIWLYHLHPRKLWFRVYLTPPQNEHLTPFENNLYDMARNTEFKAGENDFQKTLTSDLSSKIIKKCTGVCRKTSKSLWNTTKSVQLFT